MCNEKASNQASSGAGISGPRVHSWADQIRHKNEAAEKYNSLRSASMLTPGARFTAREQLGNIWTVQSNMSLAELVDLLCMPHAYSVTVEVVLPTNR